MSVLINALGTSEEQRELFLFKFRDVDRADCSQLEKDFKKFDLDKRGELNEHQALQLMEYRSTVKTARELRAMISDMDFDKNHKLSLPKDGISLPSK